MKHEQEYRNKINHLDDLVKKVEAWSRERGLDKADSIYQVAKLLEEAGELSAGILRSDTLKTIDGIGDVLVVMIILAQQLNLDITNCLSFAYKEIKDRKGKVVEGVFVKESDLR